jgi:hypothetical protein
MYQRPKRHSFSPTRLRCHSIPTWIRRWSDRIYVLFIPFERKHILEEKINKNEAVTKADHLNVAKNRWQPPLGSEKAR